MRKKLALLALLAMASAAPAAADDGVFVRFQLLQPNEAEYFVRLGGYIHNSPWYLPKAVLPDQADKDASKRVPAGRFTPWFDLIGHAGDRLHGRLNRSGGVAELPNVTADFVCDPPRARREVVIELATAADPGHVVRRWQESFAGSLTSFLVSPTLARDAGDLEIASEMTASALCQGAKHFFYWTYGPTATSTENYWSDLRGAYDGVAATTKQLAAAEHLLAPGRPRATRVGLLYSISSDLWQPFGYVHMLERRGLYLSLVHVNTWSTCSARKTSRPAGLPITTCSTRPIRVSASRMRRRSPPGSAAAATCWAPRRPVAGTSSTSRPGSLPRCSASNRT